MGKNSDNRIAGIKEIAKSANVAIATVDRVLHNRPGVSQKTKDKINAIIKKLNYQPNILARRLASRKILQFAVLIPEDKASNYWSSQLEGIEKAEAEIRQYGINIHKFSFDPSDKLSFTTKAKELFLKKPDGILFSPSSFNDAEQFIETCRQKKIPYAFLNTDLRDEHNLFYIGLPNFQSGYQAAELLSVGIGKGKILIVNVIGAWDNSFHLSEKERGFKTYFSDNNLLNDIITIDIKSQHAPTVHKKLGSFLLEQKDVTGIFVTNSQVHAIAGMFERNEKGPYWLATIC